MRGWAELSGGVLDSIGVIKRREAIRGSTGSTGAAPVPGGERSRRSRQYAAMLGARARARVHRASLREAMALAVAPIFAWTVLIAQMDSAPAP